MVRYVFLFVLHVKKRALMCRRAIRVNSQLKSHKRFANAFLTYCQLVENARLYCMNALEGPPKEDQKMATRLASTMFNSLKGRPVQAATSLNSMECFEQQQLAAKVSEFLKVYL
ncbi:hypothetical protein ACB092_06G129800 [Castanea dentata]